MAMTTSRACTLTLLAMLAFASNSLLCRLALRQPHIDAGSFTVLRIASGAITLWLIVRLRGGPRRSAGDWRSAFALFAYAAAFSLAYLGLTAATGALLLFGSVQITMFGLGWWRGERQGTRRLLGLALALTGLAVLLLPGLAAPSLHAALLMAVAGMGWGVYTLRGRGSADALGVTAGNFGRAVVPAMALWLAMLPWAHVDALGTALALASGCLASGVGYAVWYSVLPALRVSTAATVQLSVPAIAALGGALFLTEPLSLRFLLATTFTLGGIALAVTSPRRSEESRA